MANRPSTEHRQPASYSPPPQHRPTWIENGWGSQPGSEGSRPPSEPDGPPSGPRRRGGGPWGLVVIVAVVASLTTYGALFIGGQLDRQVIISEPVGQQAGAAAQVDPDLVRIAREHVEGAHFAAHFYPDSELPFVRDFGRRFEAAYAEVPDVLAAQSFDAANLVLVQLARGRESREDLREGVLRVEGYPGVTGVLTMRSDGNASKRPFLLGVERGRFHQVGLSD